MRTDFKKSKFVAQEHIEGEEYNLFEHLIDNKAIEYIDKIYCDWHYTKIKDLKKSKKRHIKIVKKLKECGFDIKGNDSDYEIWKVLKQK